MRPSNARWAARSIALTVAMLSAGAVAHAAPTDEEKARATTLFNEAKSLLADGKVPEACRKLEESERLDPLPGTLLNLAVCHEKEGLLPMALAEFREARALADRDGRADRVALADDHIKALEPKPAQVVEVVGPEAVPAPAPAAAPAPVTHEEPVAESTGLSTRRKLALASAGLGVVGLGLGSYFGLRAIQKHGDPERTCTTTPCSSTSISLNDDAKLSADVATVSFAVALAALGGAAFLWFGDAPVRSTAQVRLSPSFVPGRSSVALTGAF